MSHLVNIQFVNKCGETMCCYTLNTNHVFVCVWQAPLVHIETKCLSPSVFHPASPITSTLLTLPKHTVLTYDASRVVVVIVRKWDGFTCMSTHIQGEVPLCTNLRLIVAWAFSSILNYRLQKICCHLFWRKMKISIIFTYMYVLLICWYRNV